MEMDTMANTPAMKRGGRHAKHADGGETGPKKAVQKYNAVGSEAMKSAEDETPDFKKGGRSKRKAGGMAEGGAAPMRADKAPRGNYARGGRTGSSGPYSSGRTLTAPSTDKAAMGHESIVPPSEPD